MNEALTQHIFVCKRPGVDVFLERVAALFEVVVFTASLSTYADPVLDFLDPQQRLVRHRLYREHCVQLNGLFIKDLSKLGRSLDDVLIVDNSPASYLLHPDHAWAIRSWFSDPADGELPRLLGPLHELASLPTLSVPEWRKRHQSSP
jgi:RNA polymerase II subunit A small phosphatase-like protein